jgi:hypothetical protein
MSYGEAVVTGSFDPVEQSWILYIWTDESFY